MTSSVGNMPKSARSRCAFTLIELLVVMAIIGLTMGLGVALLTGTDQGPSFNATLNQVYSTLHFSGYSSRTDRSPAWVFYQDKEKLLTVVRRRDVMDWHLEGMQLAGPYGNGSATADVTVVPGRMGMGFQMTAKSVVDLGTVPAFDPGQGIILDLWLYSASPNRGRTILSKGRELSLATNAQEELTAQIGKIQLTASGIKIPLRRWIHVRLLYSMTEAQLTINDREAASVREATAWMNEKSLQLGSDKNGFQGIVDEVKVALLIPRERVPLSPQIKVTVQGVKPDSAGRIVIHLDSSGRLDSRIHTAPVIMTFEHDKDKASVEIATHGSITLDH